MSSIPSDQVAQKKVGEWIGLGRFYYAYRGYKERQTDSRVVHACYATPKLPSISIREPMIWLSKECRSTCGGEKVRNCLVIKIIVM